MKKILIATTALVATAGVAAAEVSVSGWGYAQVVTGDAITADGSSQLERGARLQFGASTQTDAGLGLSYYARMTSYNGGGTEVISRDQVDGEDVTANVAGENGLQWHRITMSMNGFTLDLGNANGAARTGGRAAIGYLGVDNGTIGTYFGLGDNSFGGVQTDGGDNAVLRYNMGAMTFAASAAMNGSGATEFGFKYSDNGLTVGYGASNDSNWMAMAAYQMGDITVTAGANSGDKTIGSVAYNMGNGITLTAVTANVNAGDSYGLDVSYDLGGGATLMGQFGQAPNGNTGAALGVFFTF